MLILILLSSISSLVFAQNESKNQSKSARELVGMFELGHLKSQHQLTWVLVLSGNLKPV